MAGENIYNYYRSQLKMTDVLEYVGFSKERGSGNASPTYISSSSPDKFVICGGNTRCFKIGTMGEVKDVLSFITSFPEMFPEYSQMRQYDRTNKTHRAHLIHLVCGNLLNEPVSQRVEVARERGNNHEGEFVLSNYEITPFNTSDFEHNVRPFHWFFKNRGINPDTRKVFGDNFMITTKANAEAGKEYKNISFPLYRPSDPHGEIVGFELRSMPDSQGRCVYKGLATGSKSGEALWIAQLKNGRSAGSSTDLSTAKDVYWFESAYDALSFYQLKNHTLDLKDAVFVSTSGHPGGNKIRLMIQATPEAAHHLCFDADKAGRQFAIQAALVKSGHLFQLSPTGDILKIKDSTINSELSLDIGEGFDFASCLRLLEIDDAKLIHHQPSVEYKDWNDELLHREKETLKEQTTNSLKR